MKHTMKGIAMVAVMLGSLAAGIAQAETLVWARGQHGWESTDTRVGGVNATTAPDIDSRIQFVLGPAGSDGSLKLISPAASDKATLAYVDTSGLGGLSGFTASYRWYKDSPAGAPAPAFKLGLQTSQYGSTGSSSRIGENNWDKVLIYEPYDNPDAGSTPTGTWVTQTIDAGTGTWWMFNRTILTAVNPPHGSLTLNQWMADATYGTLLSNAQIVDVQLGVGSGNAGTVGYVDWVQTSALNGGERFNFVPEPAAVPEPATLVLVMMGGAMIGGALRMRRRQGRAVCSTPAPGVNRSIGICKANVAPRVARCIGFAVLNIHHLRCDFRRE